MKAYLAKELYKGDAAIRYDAARTKNAAALRRWNRELSLVEAIARSLPPRSTVLDLPCGTGRFHPILANHGVQIVSADISPDMIDQARARLTTASNASPLVMCDAEFLPFKDRSFDYVLCMRFFNLIPPAVAATMLREIRRVSRRGLLIEVRFDRRNSLLNMARDLKTFAARMRSSESRSTAPRVMAQDSRKVFPFPGFATFDEMARLAGFAVSRMYRIGPLLAPNPLRLCVLEHHTDSSSDYAQGPVRH